MGIEIITLVILKPLFPRDNKYNIDSKNYFEICTKLSDKLIYMSNTTNKINKKLVLMILKQIKMNK